MFGPFCLYFDRDSIFFNCVGVYILPTWMLYLTGNRIYFFLQLMIQMGYLNFLYKTHLTAILDDMTHEAYAQRIAHIMSYGIFINCIFLFTTHKSLRKSYEKVAFIQNKRVELERQKIFLLSFSHELRNLINSMMGNIQLCTLEVLSPKVQDLLQNSSVCGELLMHLVTNILDTGKAEIGDLEINPTPNNVHIALEKVWSVCSQLIKNKRLLGKMRIQKEIPNILKFDNYRLTQILMNLIGNASKFTERGSVNVDIGWIEGAEIVSDSCFEPVPFNTDEEGVFEKAQGLALLRDDLIVLDQDNKKSIKLDHVVQNQPYSKGVLKIVVSDTGSGISQEKLPTLFQKFSHISSHFSAKNLRTGLGLFVTKELTVRMGGEIRVYSQIGIGSVFIVCLPMEIIERNATVNIGMDTFLSVLRSLQLKVMIVDDMEFNVIVLSNYLAKLGVQVVEVAKNGKEAVEKFKANVKAKKRLDIITMDVEMPVMDGKEATKLIREYENELGLTSCLLAIISGNCSESQIVECVDETGKAGADFFLKKPVSIDDLAKILKMKFEKRVLALSRGESNNVDQEI